MNDRYALMDRLSVAGIVAIFGLAIYGFVTLPDSVIMGVDASGAARYGAKSELFLLPLVALGVFILLKICERAPTSMYSLPIRITAENEAAVRTWTKQFLASLRTVMILGFVCVEAAMIQATLGQQNALLIVALVVPAAILLTVALQFVTLFKLR